MTFEMTLSYILRKSVSYSNGLTLSKSLVGTYISGEYTMIESQIYLSSYLPYIIQFYSITNSPSLRVYEIFNVKKKITPEMLIGITCGSAAIFFIILACLILYCRQLKENRLNDLIDFSISEEDMQNDNNDNKNEAANDSKPTVKIIEESENEDDTESNLNYWA